MAAGPRRSVRRPSRGGCAAIRRSPETAHHEGAPARRTRTVFVAASPPVMVQPMDRRRFLSRLSRGTASLAALEPRLAARRTDPAAFWEEVRAAFFIPEDRIYLNVGTLGPQPDTVVAAVADHTRQVAATYPPRTDWDALKAQVAGLLGGDPDGWVFPRNTTEAMSFVANGLELGRGDEIITTDHEHIGGVSCWELVAERHRAELIRVPLPERSTDREELVRLIAGRITPRTRVISVSHVTFTNGLLLPVRDLAATARANGIVMVVDGAHPPGLVPVDVAEIDADFYASSPHKWLLAPQGTGLLYVGADWRERLWPTLASGGWDDLSLGAHRLNHMGTMDESRLAGLSAALRFHQVLGTDTVADRIRELRRRLLQHLLEIPGVQLHTPLGDPFAAGMAAFTLDGRPALQLQRHLAEEARVRTRVISEGGRGWMRLSPHIYTAEREIDRVAELIAAA